MMVPARGQVVAVYNRVRITSSCRVWRRRLSRGGLMANEDNGGRQDHPVRIVQMNIALGDPRRLEDAPLVIVAKLDPAPEPEERQWWAEQLRDRVKVRGWAGSSQEQLTSLHVEAPSDQVESVAWHLLAAIDDANAAYPERYPAWRREHDEQVAEGDRREQHRLAVQQDILDRVMEEYRSDR